MEFLAHHRRYLRAQAHHLNPVVQIGHQGLTEAILAQVERSLIDHELIKVRVARECELSAKECGAQIASAKKAEFIQCIGRVVTLFRRNLQSPKIPLTEEAQERREVKKKAAQKAAAAATLASKKGRKVTGVLKKKNSGLKQRLRAAGKIR